MQCARRRFLWSRPAAVARPCSRRCSKDHPAVLSLSEVLSTLGSRALTDRVLGGPTFLARMTTPSPFARALLGYGVPIREILYEPGRHGDLPLSEVPPLALAALPFLTERPLDLIAEVAPLLRARERDRLENHMRFLFDWLAGRFGKSLWIERSGSSLLFTERLAEMFPDARFVHLHRDGRDVALSMSGHAFFRTKVNYHRMLGTIGIDAFRSGQVLGVAPWHRWVETTMIAVLPPRVVVDPTVDVETCARHWDRESRAGLRMLDALDPGRVQHIVYEKLVSAPEDVLRELTDFIGVDVPDDWLANAAAIAEIWEPRWRRLPPAQIRALEAACGDSLAKLGYA